MESNIVSIAEEKGFELMDAAKALQNNYKFQDAATALRKAADIFKDQGNHIFHVKSLNNLSVVLSYMGNESMAIDCFFEGMEYIKKNNCDYLSHIFYTNIGTKYQELGDYERCLYYYLMADNTMNEKGVLIPDWKYSESWRVAGSINLGYAYFYLKDYKNAEKNALLANEYQNKYSYGFFNISIAILLCRIQCVNGNLKYCDEEIPEILTSCKSLYSSLNDYTQDIASFVELARELKRDDVWKEILETYDSIVNARNAAPFHLKAVEFWLSYYESKNMEKEYMEYCIKYTRLSQKIQIEENKEKIAALNNKITLFKTKEEFKQAQNRSQIDELTLLGNRYALKCGGDMILKNMLETHAKLGVGILDLDDFKNLNDNYGHLAGDFALKTIGSILAKCMEGTGCAYRYGGDEFVLLIPNCSKDIILNISQKIGSAILAAKIPNSKNGCNRYLSTSQGYYLSEVTECSTIFPLFECADKALYEVKKESHGNGIKIFANNSPEIDIIFE